MSNRPSSEEIARACGGEKRNANGYICRCPAHDDKTASLSINDAGIFHCHAGCTFEDISAALKQRGLALSNGSSSGLPAPKITYYTYSDENKKPLFRKCRKFPKNFFIEHYENGKWVKGIGKARRVLYQLPHLRAAIANGQRVAIAEGEKDADRVTGETGGQVVCTCNFAGSGQWLPEYNAEFKGADVTIFYDNDEPGRDRRDMLIAAMRTVARKLTVINLPEQYKDVSDFWDAGQDVTDEMREEIHIPSMGDMADDAAAWLEETVVEPDQLLEGIINAADKVALIGKSKTRKSFFALQLLLSLASGTDFLGFHVPRPRKCLLVQFEIKRENFHARLVRMADALGVLPYRLANNLKIISARGKEFDDSKIIEYAQREGFEVILFDPLYKMIAGDESKIEEMKPILKRFDVMAEATRAAIIYVHHDKKGSAGDQDTSDRGAGSGVLGRDYDSALFLTPHQDKALVGLETMARNHAPTEGQSIEWAGGCFIQNSAPLRVQTSRTAAASRTRAQLDDHIPQAAAMLERGEFRIAEFFQRLRDKGVSKDMCPAIRDTLLDQGVAEVEWTTGEKGKSFKIIRKKLQ